MALTDAGVVIAANPQRGERVAEVETPPLGDDDAAGYLDALASASADQVGRREGLPSARG